MNKFDAYFYSFYFYFARNCEAGSCVWISTYDKIQSLKIYIKVPLQTNGAGLCFVNAQRYDKKQKRR